RLAEGRLVDGELLASVQPTLIARDEPLSKVDGVLNAVQVEGDLVGRVVLEGPGAGAAPTSSAVLADVLDIARDIVAERRPPPPQAYRSMRVRSPGEHHARRYVRMTVADRPGVLGEIGTALGARGVSIASVVQFEVDEDARTAEIVLTTHTGPGEALESALAEIAAAEVVVEVGNVLAMAG
ncbi:MAG: ACT domain-containing protein, partial [Chloroflexi bacterium]|nr:ACT domain-containing protein [Chloroflexota bacterium]